MIAQTLLGPGRLTGCCTRVAQAVVKAGAERERATAALRYAESTTSSSTGLLHAPCTHALQGHAHDCSAGEYESGSEAAAPGRPPHRRCAAKVASSSDRAAACAAGAAAGGAACAGARAAAADPTAPASPPPAARGPVPGGSAAPAPPHTPFCSPAPAAAAGCSEGGLAAALPSDKPPRAATAAWLPTGPFAAAGCDAAGPWPGALRPSPRLHRPASGLSMASPSAPAPSCACSSHAGIGVAGPRSGSVRSRK
jgi:hypothetical protein